jgi:thiamine kinase-like enzyme
MNLNDPSVSNSFTNIWDEAFKTYEKQTGRKLTRDTELLKKLRSSDDLLHEIEASSGKFDEFRIKHGKLWSALGNCLKPLDLLGKTLQNAASSTPFVPAVFAGVLHLVKVVCHYHTFHD